MMEILMLPWGTQFMLALKLITSAGLAYLCVALPIHFFVTLTGKLGD